MSKRPWLLIFSAALLATGCSKKVIPPVATTPKTTLNIDEVDFTYFQGRARMILRDANKERDVKAHIRIRKDSVIWMSFNVIGVQGGKALINKDSITVVSTIDKEYYVFEYPELSKRYNFEINYDVIQSAMLGNLILPRKDDDVAQQESSMYTLKQQAGTISVINFINAASMKIEKAELKEANSNNSLVITYSNFQPVGTELFPTELFPYNGTINLFYKTMTGQLNTTIIFDYNKAELDEKEKIPSFNIPKRYERR